MTSFTEKRIKVRIKKYVSKQYNIRNTYFFQLNSNPCGNLLINCSLTNESVRTAHEIYVLWYDMRYWVSRSCLPISTGRMLAYHLYSCHISSGSLHEVLSTRSAFVMSIHHHHLYLFTKYHYCYNYRGSHSKKK